MTQTARTATGTALSYELLALYGKARETEHRDEVIAAIKAGLKARSGKTWSVTGGRGTAWGWIRIMSPKARRADEYTMTDAERAELGRLLGLSKPVHHQGERIPASCDYYNEYLDRSAGIAPRKRGTQYWD